MKESNIEKYLRDQVALIGGFHRKVVYQGRKGSPDDWCFFPGGRLLIVECKRPGKNKADPLQEYEIGELRKQGFRVELVNSKEQIIKLMMEYASAP